MVCKPWSPQPYRAEEGCRFAHCIVLVQYSWISEYLPQVYTYPGHGPAVARRAVHRTVACMTIHNMASLLAGQQAVAGYACRAANSPDETGNGLCKQPKQLPWHASHQLLCVLQGHGSDQCPYSMACLWSNHGQIGIHILNLMGALHGIYAVCYIAVGGH